MQWAKIYGARKVVVFDIQNERLELAKQFGADAGVNTLDKDFMDQAMALTDGRGYDYVYETARNTVTMKMAYKLAANKAYLSFIGTPKKEITLSVDEWEMMNRKEFTMTGSWMSYSAPFSGREWTNVVHYFQTGQLKYSDALIFKKFPLSKIDEAFKMYVIPGAVKGKILINSKE